jgi:uncharacterized membrane protein
MIIYHLVFDIQYFRNQGGFYWFSAPIASIFILVSGISLSISYSRGSRFFKFAKRGIKLLFLALIITFVTFILLKKGFIVFGILHFFGLSSFLIYLFLKYLKTNLSFLILGILIIFAGIFITNVKLESSYFLWLGFMPQEFYTFDYFPLIPWFGILLIGVFLGKFFYPDGKRSFKILEFKGKLANFAIFLGRNSLVIYFIHQPIILLIVFLLGHGELLSVFSVFK